jgi:hypothetical protein
MTIETDIAFNKKACDLADEAAAWFSANGSLAPLDTGPEPILLVDFGDNAPDRVWYIPSLDREGMKFGYIVMKPGYRRFAEAAVSDFAREGKPTEWVLCAVSDHPEKADSLLPKHVTRPFLIHEATHYLDFTGSTHKPDPFKSVHADNLGRYYYNTPHEFNAFFHQGLAIFIADLEMQRHLYARIPGRLFASRAQFFYRLLYGDGFWPIHFVHGLNRRYRRKMIRRFYRIFDHCLPRPPG